MSNVSIPNGIDHLRMLVQLSQETSKASEAELRKHPGLHLIGTSLSALYQASTCHRECHGGSHILETLAGRVYNLGCAAYILICRGFYDESLNLMRSIGEILNLIYLSEFDKDSWRRWLSADRHTRLRDFSPAKVRGLLKSRAVPIYADNDWYASFCEKYTHINPGTKVNVHNDKGLSIAGGLFQNDGMTKSLDELTGLLGSVAMPVSRYFEFDDLFEEIVREARSLPNDGKQASSMGTQPPSTLE